MYCTNCGTEVREGASFCENCGQSLGGAAAKKPPKESSSGRKMMIAGVILSVIAVLCIIGALIVVFSNGIGESPDLLEPAYEYCRQGDYESAITAFNEVLDSDSKEADAYVGLANIYITNKNYEAAAETIEKMAQNASPQKA